MSDAGLSLHAEPTAAGSVCQGVTGLPLRQGSPARAPAHRVPRPRPRGRGRGSPHVPKVGCTRTLWEVVLDLVCGMKIYGVSPSLSRLLGGVPVLRNWDTHYWAGFRGIHENPLGKANSPGAGHFSGPGSALRSVLAVGGRLMSWSRSQPRRSIRPISADIWFR